jgi:RNA polymerase sigma factor (sigma-70 family)
VEDELYQLIRDAKRGSKEAFAALIHRFKNLVYRQAYGMLGDRMEAEDASQEAFLKCYYALPRLENEFSFSSWLIRIVSNVCMDRLKKRQKERSVSQEAVEEIEYPNARDPILKMSLEEGMRQLTPEHREILLLHEIQGYRYEEIATSLGIPLGTVKSRLNAARLALRIHLKKGDD